MAYGYLCSGCIIQQLVEGRSHTSNDSPTWGGEGAEQREIQVVLCKEKKKTRLASLPSILQRTETGKYWWMTCLKSSFTQTYSSIATARQPQQGHPQLRAWRGHKSSDPFALGPHKTQTTYISHITTVENMIRERNTAVLALSCSLDTQFTYWLETGCF